MYHKTTGYKIFNSFNLLLLLGISITCVLPIIHILAVSLSSSPANTGNLVKLWPIGLTFENYAKTFNSNGLLDALVISVLRTVLGTALSMLLCFLAAYPMSKENSYFRGRTVYAWFFIITILFHGGLIPTYLVVINTGLRNSIWALILPGAVAVFNVVLMMNFFRGIPKELEEASQIDGASHLRTLFGIYLPISLPSIATLSLFTIVGHWNAWFDGVLYMEMDKQPLATLVQALVQNLDYTRLGIQPQDVAILSERGLRSTQILIGALPVLLAYPFLQKYFTKGLTLGSVKE